MKLPIWIETSQPIATKDGRAVVVVRLHTDRRGFWAEVLRTAWAEYGAFWWDPAFWVVCARFAWRYARAK